jgi:hypothetical protein
MVTVTATNPLAYYCTTTFSLMAECYYDDYYVMLSVVMLSVFMPYVVMLSIFMLTVMIQKMELITSVRILMACLISLCPKLILIRVPGCFVNLSFPLLAISATTKMTLFYLI